VSQQINLFNPIFLKQKKAFSALAMARALAVLLVGLTVFSGYSVLSARALEREAGLVSAKLKARQARLAEVTLKFPPREKNPALVAQLGAIEAQLGSMDEISTILARGDFGNTLGYAEYFRAFARQNVEGLWLTRLAIAGPGSEIDVHGRAVQAQLVPGYIARLAAEPVLKGKTFGNLRILEPIALSAPDAAGKPVKAEQARFVEFDLEALPAGGGGT